MDKQLLKQNYEKACNDYLRAFCKKHGFDSSYWIADEVGGIADCNGYYSVDLKTIRTDIDEDAKEEEFAKWYEYIVKASSLDVNTPNFHQWIHCCPRCSEDQLEELRKKREDFESYF